ncbi:MAG: outer membrane protein assembly factor BamD, partial [Myxococcota bacterium]
SLERATEGRNSSVPDDPAEDQSGGGPVGGGGLNRGELPVQVRYQRTAEGNWLKAKEAFEDDQFLTAQRYYQYIRTKFPYSRYAALSEVRIADCQYGRQRYLEAIDTYQSFVRTHPTHKEVPYAMYRVGTGYYEQIPGDFFMLPPSHEKDQTAVRDAERKLAEYVRRFPKDENTSKAQEKLDEVRKRLMAHERYVADFYQNLNRDRAYVGRLEVIRRDYADVGLNADLLLEITEVWSRLGEVEKAKNAVAQLNEKFKDSNRLADAQRLITVAEEVAAKKAAAKKAAAERRAARKAAKAAAEKAEAETPAEQPASAPAP